MEFAPEKLVKYRQHGANAIGAKSFWHGLNPLTNWIEGWRRGDDEFIDTIKQSQAFRTAMAGRLENQPESEAVLNSYCTLESATRLQRLQTMRLKGLWRTHWFSNLILLLRLLLLPRTQQK
jgi:hypothetical protein